MSDQAMTKSDLEHYWEHGYVVIRGLFDSDALDGWKERRYRTAETSIIEQAPNVTILRKPSFGSS